MRLFMLELKRLLKNRRTLLIVGALLAFTVFMAVMPTTYLMSHTADGDTLTGLDALAYDKELQSGIAGTVTPEKVRDSLETYQSVFAHYSADSTFDLPDAAYAEINAVQSLLNGVGDLYPAENGQPTPWLALDAEAVASYYEAAPARIAGLMAMEYPNDPAPAGPIFSISTAPWKRPSPTCPAPTPLLSTTWCCYRWCFCSAAPSLRRQCSPPTCKAVPTTFSAAPSTAARH